MQTNRSFLYGESVFTTAMVTNGKIIFLSDHLDRLLKGAGFLWGPFSEDEKNALKTKILQGIPQHSTQDGLRITLSYQDGQRQILRNSFDKDSIHVDYLSFWRGEKKAAKLKTFKASDEHKLFPSFLKNSRRVLQTLTLFRTGYISEEESLLFCGPDEEVFETSWANIFAVKGNILYTPPSGSNVLAGIMRENILRFPQHQFDQVKEESFTLSWLKTCDFVFVSNALWGIVPVERIDAVKFNQPTLSFFEFEKVILNEAARS